MIFAATEGGGGLVELAGQFGIDAPFLIAQIINFCIVAFLLYKFALKPLTATIEERQKKISDGLQYAEEMKKKLEETEKMHAETLRKAQQEAQEVMQKARADAQQQTDRQMQDASRKIEDMLAKAQEAAESERRKAIEEARKEIARLVALVAERALAAEMTGEQKKAYAARAAEELARAN